MKKLILIDSNALVHRAFHALPPTLTSPQGVPTNAVYGFTSVLLKMLKDLQPDYVAATFDLAGPTFRHDEFAEYKAHRVKAPDELYAQIPPVKQILTAFGIPIFEKQGFEADDVIGSLAEKARKIKDLQVVIVTGDLDTLQLVEGKKVVVFTLRKGMTDTVTYDEDQVRERYGLKPEQVVDFKGLKGDPSDNIPGVKGIGEKTASTLIQEFGSIENLYKKLEIGNWKLEILKKEDTTKPKSILTESLLAKLKEHKDMAFFSKKLATIIRSVEVDFSIEKMEWREHADRQLLEKLLRDLGFYSLVKRLPEALGTLAANPVQGTLLDPVAATAVSAEQESSALVDAKYTPEGEAAISIISGDSDVPKEISFATADGVVHIVPLRAGKIPPELFRKITLLIGHDLKPVFRLLLEQGAELRVPVFDTKIAAYLLNPDLKDYDLGKLIYAEFGQVVPEDIRSHSALAFRLKASLVENLKTSGLLSVFDDIEMPLVGILAEMEFNGIAVNTGALRKLLVRTTKEVHALEKKIYKLAGAEFNINSPQQLGDILFNKLAIRGKIRKTGGGALSTAADELEKIREANPIVPEILEYRELQKLKTTYIEPFPALVAKDGRVHTTYNQAGTTTGRLASQEPNLQNIPTRTELGQEFRKAFVARKGYKLVSFDYSQLELRIVAHIAQDEKMIAAFKRGEDIHTRTAVEILKVPADKITKEMRRQAKVLNFGIIYGMGVLGFARSAGVDRETAHRFMDEYFREFHGVAQYMENTRRQAGKDGYVKTIFGRRRPLPDINSSMPQMRAQAERMAINHPVQGTGADLIKMAMNRVHEFLRKEKLHDAVKMLLQVHDELVFEVREDCAHSVIKEIRRSMETAHVLSVPLVVDVSSGANWAEMGKIKN